MATLSPYNGSANNVGQLVTTLTPIYTTSGASIVGGSAALKLMAKVAASTPESSDYQDTLTFTAAAAF
jgi:hypothetical protein